jgi:biotin operon repressor
MDKFKDPVLAVLEMNVGTPVSRKVLTQIYGKDERSFRNHVQELRRMGYRICYSSEESGGYFLAKDSAQYKAWRKSYVQYAKAIFYTASCMDRQTKIDQEEWDLQTLAIK